MSMAVAIQKHTREAEGDPCVAIREIGWKGYCSLLRMRGDRSMPRMVYLDGTVWLKSPAFPHERLKTRLGQFVIELIVGLDIRPDRARHHLGQAAQNRGQTDAQTPRSKTRSGWRSRTRSNNVRPGVVR